MSLSYMLRKTLGNPNGTKDLGIMKVMCKMGVMDILEWKKF